MIEVHCPPLDPLPALAEFAARNPVRGFPGTMAQRVLLHLRPRSDALLDLHEDGRRSALAAVLELQSANENRALFELLILGERGELSPPALAALLDHAQRAALALRHTEAEPRAATRRAALDIALLPGREAWRPALEQRGYGLAYTFCEMEHRAPLEPQPLALPAGTVLQQLALPQAAAYHRMATRAFADIPGSFVPELAQIERSLREGQNLTRVLARADELLAFVRTALRESAGARIGVIELLGRDPARRSQGLGGALLRHALASLYAQGAAHIELEVVAENKPALELYRRHGFQVARTWAVLRRALQPAA